VSKTAALKQFQQQPGVSFRKKMPFVVSVGCLNDHGGIYNLIRKESVIGFLLNIFM
jgi:hypothetical protein